MDTSIVLAQIMGIMFVVFGLSMLVNKKWTAVMVEDLVKNQGLIWIAGLIALTMGSVTVALNNVWTSGLTLFVTVVGWLALIKGAVILIFPNLTISWYGKMNKGNILFWAGAVILILGVILLFVAL